MSGASDGTASASGKRTHHALPQSARLRADTTIADVDLNLFTRRLSIVDLRVGGGTAGPPLAAFDRLDAELQLVPLVRGRLHLVTATLRAPVVQLVRNGPAAFNVSPVIKHWLALERGDEPLDVTIEQLTVRDGVVLFHDRAVSPPPWRSPSKSCASRRATSASWTAPPHRPSPRRSPA